MGNKEVEYIEANNLMRHMLDSRANVFSFAIGFNGAVMAVVMQYVSQNVAKILVSIFALATTFVFSRIERRKIYIYDQYIKHGRMLETILGYTLLSETFSGIEKTRFRTRDYYMMLYWLIMLLWIIQIGITIPNLL